MLPRLAVTGTLLIVVGLSSTPPADASAWKFFGWLDELSGPGPFKGPTFSLEHCIGRTDLPDVTAYSDKVTLFLEAREALEAARMKRPAGRDVPTQEERAADNAYKDAEAELRSATRRIRSTICKFDRSNQRLALSYEFSPRMKMIDDVTPQYLGEMYVQRHVGVVYMSLASIAEALDGPDLDQHGAIAEGPGRHRFLRGVELGSGFGMHRYRGSAVIGNTMWHPVIPLRGRLTAGGLIPATGRRTKLQRYISPLSFRFGWDLVPGPLDSSAFNYTGDPIVFVDKAEFVWTSGFSYDFGLLIFGKH
jgi:hypothetical protein